MDKYPSLLIGHENASPLPTGVNLKGEALMNDIQKDEWGKLVLSKAYVEFVDPIDKTNNGFGFDIYYMQNAPDEIEYAGKLHERIRREFPENLSILGVLYGGTHPVAMFEVDTFTPHMTGTLFSWLVVNLSCVFIHPNTDEYRDHTELVTWVGRPWLLNMIC
ncbi:uncharacterized protein BT62DRAFT_1055379 [Guyanagaster necrorhizus]|uniref:Uncharacterized protein n=1 Tax=Guyanagaster necrorhizus TaxID=856835 RepID=A0A9P7VFV5_9AGAR|nr:uncharacterized protein BT62DRAFT_1055379 [Guyanagaster necrorhizus MCA 3950]KAG7439635.1 hypothetical protein BT62DRAFT_1055379 [Guyanagaster necrorhizus MCA 3950]